MNYQTSYHVDEDLVVQSAKQIFHKVYLKRNWMVVLGLFVFAGLILLFPGSSDDEHLPMVYVLVAIGSVFTIMWVKTYFVMLANTKSAFNATGGGVMQVTIEKGIISITSAAGSRSIQLDKVTQVLETRDFLVFMADKVPVLALLKEALSSEAKTWLLSEKTD